MVALVERSTGGGGGTAVRLGLRDALQAQRLSPPSHSKGTASDHELAGLRIWPAAAGRCDLLAGRDSAVRVASPASKQPRWPTDLRRHGDRSGADIAARFPSRAAPGRRVYPLGSAIAGVADRRARPFAPQPAWPRLRRTPAARCPP